MLTTAGFNRRMRKTACPVVWKAHGAQSPWAHPIHPLLATRQPVGFSIGPQRSRQHHRAFLEFPAYPQTHLSRAGNGSPTPSASPQIRKINFSTHHLANSVADIQKFALRDFPRPMPHDTASRSHKPLWQKVTLPGQPASEEIRLVNTNEMPVSERFACDLEKKYISSIQGCQNKLTTELNTPAAALIQAYFDHWQIEVNHREEKSNFGIGDAQVRDKNRSRANPHSP